MKVSLPCTLLVFALASPFMATASQQPPAPSKQQIGEGYALGADGVRLFYRKIGNAGNVAVYLHGGPGSGFRGTGTEMEPLSQNQTLIMYDQRGSGLSEVVTDPRLLTIQHHVRDLEALRQYFGISRMSLIGLSWGSGLAVLYASEHPDRVTRLLLVSPVSPTKALYEERRARLSALRGEAVTRRLHEIPEQIRHATDQQAVALCRENINLTFPAYLVNATPEALRKAAKRCDIPPAAIRNRFVLEDAWLASVADWDFRSLFARVEIPTLVVEGSETNVPLDATREWAGRIPNARMLLIPHAGHELFLDPRDAFLSAADSFLKGRYPRVATVIRRQ